MSDKEIISQITKDILVNSINKNDICGDVKSIATAYKEIFEVVESCYKTKSVYENNDIRLV